MLIVNNVFNHTPVYQHSPTHVDDKIFQQYDGMRRHTTSRECVYFKTFQQYLFKSSPLATDPPGQLDILGHNGHPLGVDGTKVGVLKEANQIGLASLLQSHHSRALEPQISLEVLSNLANKALEW